MQKMVSKERDGTLGKNLKEMLDVKNYGAEMKSTFDGLINKLDTTKQELLLSLEICQWKLLKLKCKEGKKGTECSSNVGKLQKV